MACSMAYNPRSLRCSDNKIPQELQGHLEVKGALQGAFYGLPEKVTDDYH